MQRLLDRAEMADDPSCNAKTANKIWTQHLMQMNYELPFPNTEGRSTTAVSFNAHDSSMGEAFSIRAPDGETPHNGCVGFELERFADLFMRQRGLVPAGWPDLVARSVLRSGATERRK